MPQPLRVRILAALELAPMTTVQLSLALSANRVSVQHWVDELHRMGVIEPKRRQHVRNGRPRNVWGIAA